LDPKKLERSLHSLLTRIPWLAGRLRADSDSTFAYEVGPQPALALAVTHSNKSFDDLSDEELVPFVESRDGERLMHARLTQTPEGSVLGVSMSHALTDGFSFFLAMSMWAALARGEAVEAPPLQRLLQAPEQLVAAAMQRLDPHTLLDKCGLFWGKPRLPAAAMPSRTRIHLSAASIADLVADAQRSVDQKVRENDVLTAWLWRTYGAQQLSAAEDNPMMYMSCPADLRRLLGKGNERTFGLSISWATSRATHRELMLSPLGQLALRVQHSVARVFASDHASRTAPFEALRRLHGVNALQSIHLRHPQHGMLVTNMSRLPLAQLDFGCGAPSSVRLVSELDGMAAILPARDGVTISVSGRRNQALTRHAPRAVAAPGARARVIRA
jgi:shikimate O-hydroxycinnamoyltransferase